MTERIFIGNDAGTFKMRISRPGILARNAGPSECFIHEQHQQPLIFVMHGYAVIAPGATATINLGRSFSYAPVLILKHESHNIAVASARLNLTNGQLSISVLSSAVGSLVKYVVMAPQ